MRSLRRIATLALCLGALSLFAPDLAHAVESTPARSDAMVRRKVEARYKGDNAYNRTGVGQTRTKPVGARGGAVFYVRVQNDGTAPDTFAIKATGSSRRFGVRYFVGGKEVTRRVVRHGILFRNLAPGASRVLRVNMNTRGTVPVGARHTATVKATSRRNGSVDVAKSKLYRPGSTTTRSAYTNQQQTVAELINKSRADYGRRSLRLNKTLTEKAQRWAEYLARIGYLKHSNLASGVPSNWRALAENVGYGSRLGTVHGAFLRSSGHRANIMGNYTHVGTGVAKKGDRVYVVHVFMRA